MLPSMPAHCTCFRRHVAVTDTEWPIKTAPFYAIPICAAITNTMGGIVVDGNGAVLDQSDTPMPGLFAAGSTVGGLDGGPNAGYVGGLIKATIALRAAEAIAAS